jgi:hypothetical protein
LISEKLRRLGIATEVQVFESLLNDAKLQMVERNRQAYRRSFRVALASQKIVVDMRRSVDASALELLLARWRAADRRHFICLSGHWVYILDQYRELIRGAIHADLLYLDAELSPSWKWLRTLKPEYATDYREVRLYDHAQRQPLCSIDINVDEPLPTSSRSQRLVVHGGGWGIGTFEQHLSAIERAGYELDVVGYDRSEAVTNAGGRRYLMDDPDWRAWHRNEAADLTFPPFGLIDASGEVSFAPQAQCHGLHRVIRRAQAIVSKPGAGTLIDSFGAATPLIMLDAFGPHEEGNAQVWSACGFGIAYHEWAEAGCPSSTLHQLQRNLLAHRRDVKDYASDYAALVGRH